MNKIDDRDRNALERLHAALTSPLDPQLLLDAARGNILHDYSGKCCLLLHWTSSGRHEGDDEQLDQLGTAHIAQLGTVIYAIEEATEEGTAEGKHQLALVRFDSDGEELWCYVADLRFD